MRRTTAFFMALLLVMGLAPCAFADELIERPLEGQVIFLEADNDLDYSLDFPLWALKEMLRSEDDLILVFPAAKLTFRGFFTRLDQWRSISFSDGTIVGGADFGPDGRFTGSYSSAEALEKSSHIMPTVPQLITARYTQYGIEILQNEKAVSQEIRKGCMDWLSLLDPAEKPDWQRVRSLFYEFSIDENGLLPLRCFSEFNDGITVSCLKPQVVYISGSLSLLPISVGRASVSYKNSIGEELLSLDVRCLQAEDGQLSLSSICPACGEDQGGQLHFGLCGHFSCAEAFDAGAHSPAECGIAGHCASDGDHSRCKNCLEPLCNGMPHGYGQCKHVHNYMMISIYTSRCVSCGHEYTSPPRTG